MTEKSPGRGAREKVKKALDIAQKGFQDWFLGEAVVIKKEMDFRTGRPREEEVVIFRAPKIKKHIQAILPKRLRHN